MPMTQVRPASRLRNSTARISPARSAQNARTAVRASGPGLIATTRKIAARVRGDATGCEITPSTATLAVDVRGTSCIDPYCPAHREIAKAGKTCPLCVPAIRGLAAGRPWSQWPKFLVAVLARVAGGLEQEPGAFFGLVDPVLDQACGRDILVIVSHFVGVTHLLRDLLVVVHQFTKHVARRDEVVVVVLDALEFRDVT